MKNLVKLVILMTYTFIVFFISQYYILGGFFVFNILIMCFGHINVKTALKELLTMLPFIMFAAGINLVLGDINEMLLIAIRLILVCNITYGFKHLVSSMELANAIETLCYPLRWCKFDPKDISLMVCICIAFIPILQRELHQIIAGLKAKGMKMTIQNTKYILKPFLYGIFKRTDEIADALKAKAYIEN
ncbi:MAG: energy-coupling factor transporter transmembrane protein EcfT [Treponema sp.]|jgi:energy-coupling factor transporter transmembrane protein EcfT|nr:energy-coupling factor transporter transmembrane protein EcfT [Treponema sp.]